jgi:6-phosphogluconolactonase (cycloisomerase 2 family)
VVKGALCNPAANGSLNYWPLTSSTIPSTDVVVPTAVNALASGADLYVTAYDSTANVGYVFGFSVTSATGALTPLANSPWKTGNNSHPSAIASDPGSKYLYVTDSVAGKVLGYSVASGLLTPLSGSPFPAGDQPSAIVVDANASYVYVTNAVDATVNAYSISSGNLTRIGTYATGLQPVAIGIDPNKSQFLFTVNYLGGNVSGFELSATDGSLVDSQNSPYTANAQPTAVVAIPHNGQ